MALLAFGGAEIDGLPADGLATAGTITRDTSIKYAGGIASLKFTASGQYLSLPIPTTRMMIEARIYLTANPSADMKIIHAEQSAAFRGACFITTTGKLKGLAGTASSASVPLNDWFTIRYSHTKDGSNVETIWLKTSTDSDFVQVFSAGSGQSGLGNVWRLGIQSGGGGCDLYIDDWIVHDGSGASDTDYPHADAIVRLAKPVSDGSIGTDWKRGNNTAISSDGYDAINNQPPVGVAVGSATATSQLFLSGSSSTHTADFVMQTYKAAAAADAGTVKGCRSVINVADNSTTLTAILTHLVQANPSGSSTNITSPTQTAGTYPTNWTYGVGAINGGLSQSADDAATLRLGPRAGGSASQAHVDFAGVSFIIAPIATQHLTTPLLDPGVTLYPPTVTDYEIQDPGTVDDPLTGTVYISGETVRSITEVRLFINAPASNHLLITLKPPDNSPEVTIFDHRGSGADVGASSGSPLILRDDASTTLASGFVSGTGQTLKPENPLSTFHNESGGLWTITVTDTTTSTVLTLTYALITSTGPKSQKKVLKPKLLTVTPTLFPPTVYLSAGEQMLTMPLLTVTPTLFPPALALKVSVPLLTVTPTLFAPSVSVGTVTLQTPLLDVTPELFGPYLDPQAVQLAVPLLTVAPEFFGPTLTVGTVTLHLPLLTVTPQFFGMAVNPREVTLSLPVLSVTPELFAPTVRMRLLVPLLDVPPELFAPTLHQGLLVPLLEITPQLFGPTLRLYLSVPFLEITPELFPPTVHMRLVLPVLVVTPELFGPQVNVGLVTLTLPLLDVVPLVISPRLIRRVFRSQVGHQKTTAMAGQKEGTGPGYQKITDWSGDDEGTDPGHREYSNPGHFEVV